MTPNEFRSAQAFPASARQGVLAVVAMLAATCSMAAPQDWSDACYVRAEDFSAAPAASAAPRSAPSFVGLRRTSNQLFELDISVSGPHEATCSIAGIARLRGAPGAETLAMVVRPDPSRKAGPSGSLCQIFVQPTETAVELRTTRASCQEQALCEGRVELDGQRFERASKGSSASTGPCSGQRAANPSVERPLPAAARVQR